MSATKNGHMHVAIAFTMGGAGMRTTTTNCPFAASVSPKRLRRTLRCAIESSVPATRPTSCAVALLAALLLAISLPVRAQTPPPYRDPHLPIQARVQDLIARMTLEEKTSMMSNATPGVPRLGIPRYDWWSEALHGVANAGYATVFPQAIGLAAMWDESLQRQIAHVIGVEGRAKFNGYVGTPLEGAIFRGLTFWSPNINIFRDPRWGRGQETYGEDPYLTGRLGVAFVRGLQGDHPHFLLAAAARLRRGTAGARSPRDVPARVRRPRPRGGRRDRHDGLQRGVWRPGLHQPLALRLAGRLGLRWSRHVRLWLGE
jgi:hypothetical protein